MKNKNRKKTEKAVGYLALYWVLADICSSAETGPNY